MPLPPEWEPLIEKLTYWADNPVAFVREAIGADDLDEWQLEFFSALGKDQYITVRAGRGVAKSTTISWTILWQLLCFMPVKIIVTAPKVDTVQDVIWSEVEIWRQKLPKLLGESVVVQSDKIFIRDHALVNFAIARTARADNPDALRGFHSENILIICEESSGVADSSFEVLEGTLTTPSARMILVGNMSRTSGYFYNTHFNDKSNIWSKIHVNAEDVATRGHAWYNPKFVASKQDQYGRDSDQYRIEVMGEPPLSEDGAVIPRYLVEAAIWRDVQQIPGYRPVWGLDIGRTRDRSALAKRCGNVLLEPVKWWRVPDGKLVADAVIDEYRETEKQAPGLLPQAICVDVIGVGATVTDILRHAGLPARGINVAEAHSVKSRFRRKRDEIWWRAREWFDRKDVRIPNDQDLVGELASVQYKRTPDGHEKVQSKEDIVSESRASPDLADAFILTFAVNDGPMQEEREQARYYFNSRSTAGSYAPSWMSV